MVVCDWLIVRFSARRSGSSQIERGHATASNPVSGSASSILIDLDFPGPGRFPWSRSIEIQSTGCRSRYSQRIVCRPTRLPHQSTAVTPGTQSEPPCLYLAAISVFHDMTKAICTGARGAVVGRQQAGCPGGCQGCCYQRVTGL